MEKKRYTIEFTKEQLTELHLDSDQPIYLTYEKQMISLYQKKNNQKQQSISLRWFFLPSFFVSLLFFSLLTIKQIKQLPLTGSFSLGSALFVLGLLSGMLLFSLCLIIQKKRCITPIYLHLYWRHIPTIIFSFLIILALFMMSFFWLLSKLFIGASFDIYTATGLFFICISFIHYLMIYFSLSLSPFLMLHLLVLVIVSGVGFSMLVNNPLKWWKINFSFLGTNQAINSWQFNITLILTSLLMLAFIDFIFVSFYYQEKKRTWQRSTLRLLLTLVAISLGGIGCFPNNGNGQLHYLHNQAANLLVYLLLLLIVTSKLLLPTLTKEFFYFSIGTSIALFLSNILFQFFHYLSLTAFELIAFILAFSWLILLMQTLLYQLEKPSKSLILHIKKD